MASPYTTDQLDKYLKHVSLPLQYQCTVSSICVLDCNFLNALHVAHLCRFPFENLSLHYSKERKILLDPHSLYHKFMAIDDSQGRGGTCMEGNIFFKYILRGLGFDIYCTGVRARPRVNGVPQGDYMGWVHCLNIITLSDGTRYMSDVSFGGDGPTKTILLEENRILKNIGTHEMRLIRDYLPDQIRRRDETQMSWIYQGRYSPEQSWISFYSFTEMEFLDQDFEVINYFTSNGSFQARMVLMVKFLQREYEVYGKIMLIDGEIKINDTGRTRLIKTCKTEEERISALDQYFGVRLTADEMEGIKGCITELNEA